MFCSFNNITQGYKFLEQLNTSLIEECFINLSLSMILLHQSVALLDMVTHQPLSVI